MTFSEKQISGAKSLLQKGLHLTANDSLVVLHQIEFTNAAQCIQQAAYDLELKFNNKQFSKEDFYKSVPHYLISAISNQYQSATPKAIILLMEWSEKTTQARLEFLKILTDFGEKWRIASMPGVRLENFDLCVCDLQEITSKSLDVFSVLARGRKAIIKSKNPHGLYDILTIPIESTHPIMSTGEIAPGSWGNFPSGETFIVPNEYRAFGWITIKGSFPNYSMKENEWLRIEIKRGRMVGKSISASSQELKDMFMKLFFNSNGRAKSENTNTLAELGIGTNENIQYLTGNPIFDEKKAGTIHIAFGRNTQFGGPIVSRSHHDVTCKDISVEVSNLIIVNSGQIKLTNEQATPKLDSFQPKNFKYWNKLIFGDITYKNDVIIGDNNIITKRLLIQYMSRSEEIRFVVAEGECANEAYEILEKYRKNQFTIDEIINQSKNQQLTKQLLTGMLEYNLLKLKR